MGVDAVTDPWFDTDMTSTETTTTGRQAGKGHTMPATLTVRIANFPIDARGMWGKIDGTIECRAELVASYCDGRMAEFRLIDPPMPYEPGERLALDRLADGTYGPLEVLR